MTPSYQAVDQPPLLLEGFQRIGEEVLAGLPETFTRHLGGVVIKVEDFPDADTECAMELESLYDLLGLYHGVPVGHDLAFAQCEQPDMIFFVPKTDACLPVRPRLLTRRHHRNTLIHEIGHHFGLSDDDMENIEYPQRRAGPLT